MLQHGICKALEMFCWLQWQIMKPDWHYRNRSLSWACRKWWTNNNPCNKMFAGSSNWKPALSKVNCFLKLNPGLESSESESCSASWCSPRQATKSVWCFSWQKTLDESDSRGNGSYSWSYMAIKKTNRRNSSKPISPGNLWLGSVHGYCWWKTSCIKIASNEYLC